MPGEVRGRRLLAGFVAAGILLAGCGGSGGSTTHTVSKVTVPSGALKTACARVSGGISALSAADSPVVTQLSGHSVQMANVRGVFDQVRTDQRDARALGAAAPPQDHKDIAAYAAALTQEMKGAREAEHHKYSSAYSDLVAASDRLGPFLAELNKICP